MRFALTTESRSIRPACTVLGLAAFCCFCGCGAPSEDASGGAGGVVPLGPSPIGDDDANDDDGGVNDNVGETPPNDNVASNENENLAGDGNSDGDQSNDNAGDGSTGGTDFANACEAVAGHTFVSGNLSISFTNTLFNWVTSDGLVTGAYTCNRFELLGIAPDEGQFVGDYDPATDTVAWQGIIYFPPS